MGTVDAYSLDGMIIGLPTTIAYADELKSLRSLFVSDYEVCRYVSWNDLYNLNLIYGKNFDNANYLLRTLSGGSYEFETYGEGSKKAKPLTNEWDQIQAKGTLTEPIKNWSRLVLEYK